MELIIENGIKIFVSVGICVATFRLIKTKINVANYTAAVTGLFLISLIWAIDFGSASRIVLLGIEIDRRVALAEDAIARLKDVEDSAVATQNKLLKLERQASETADNIQRVSLQEKIRGWLLIYPNGMKTDHTLGALSGSSSSLQRDVFSLLGTSYTSDAWTWSCDNESMKRLGRLTDIYPLSIYPNIALATCQRIQGDPNWDLNTNGINSLLSLYLNETPRVQAIDQFAKLFNALQSGNNNTWKAIASNHIKDEPLRYTRNLIRQLPFKPIKTEDGFVLNYSYSFIKNKSSSRNSHQGAPDEIIPIHENLISRELDRTDEKSIREIFKNAIPSDYELDSISIRMIFDENGYFELLQDIDGYFLSRNGKQIPFGRILND